MPQLSDLMQKRKFVKKEYRPWDLSGSGTVDNKETTSEMIPTETTQISVENSVILVEPTNVPNLIDTSNAVLPPAIDVTGNKTDNESDNKQVTNGGQRGTNEITISKHLGNKKVSIREQISNKADNVTSNISDLANLFEAVKKLFGIQKSIFYYVINVCSARGALDTGHIMSNDLAIVADCSIGSAKTSLARLIEKQLVLRLEGKASRGGHMVLGITKEIQAAAIQAQQALFNPLKITNTDNKTGNVLSNTLSYSSSNKNITTTSLPEEWQKINFELLEHIGFSETQLRQLCNSNMTTPEIVQDAINRFAYSLEHNDKAKAYTDPLNVLMGVLRKGQRWNEANYVSPKELALKQLLEENRKEKEKREVMIKELVELEFPEWRRKLSEEELKAILPPDVQKTKLAPAIHATLKTYFIENILLPKIEL